MKMKRSFWILVLCLVLLTGCKEQTNETVSDASYTASGNGTITVSLDTVTAAPGESCQVAVRASENAGIAATDLMVEFDSDRLTYESFAASTDYQSGYSVGELIGDGRVKIALVTLNPPKAEAVIGTITFTVKEDADGTIPLKLTYSSCCDYNTVKLKPDCVNGMVKVEK